MNRQTFIDLLAAGRVANLPSVVSNVMLGAGLGVLSRNYYLEAPVFILPVVVGCLMYLGGCFLNDWSDRNWDAKNKPERAIPSGRLSAKLLLGLALGCVGFGIASSFFLGLGPFMITWVLFGFIALYTWIHKKSSWGVLPMGCARGLLYPLGFFSQAWPIKEEYDKAPFLEGAFVQIVNADISNQAWVVLPVFFGLVAYIAGLSLFARAESQPVVPQMNRLLGIIFLCVPASTHSMKWMLNYPFWSSISLIPFVVFVILGIRAMQRSVPKGVSLLLASICLVDFTMAMPLALVFMFPSYPYEVHNQAILFPIVSLSAFVLALILQKVAPAT